MTNILSYILGSSPTFVWCYARSLYRSLMPAMDHPVHPQKNTITYVFGYPLPDLGLWEPKHTLFSDLLNIYDEVVYRAKLANYHRMQMAYQLAHSPSTYGVCPGDDQWYTALVLPVLALLSVAVMVAVFYTVRALLRATVWNSALHYRYLASQILTWGNEVSVKPEFYRSAWTHVPTPELKQTPGHSHAAAAASRNSDSHLARLFCSAVGAQPYFYQCSAADKRKSLSGSRSFYWAKDIPVAPAAYDPKPDHIVVMVDVDEYLNMPDFLAHNRHPVVIATVQPTACAAVHGNFAFTFDDNNVMDYRVSGGGHYRHPVWNYSQDNITTSAKFCGVPYRSALYAVDRRTTDAHHDVILLTPIARYGFLTTLANWIIGANELQRYQLFTGTHNRLRVKTEHGMLVSTAAPNQLICATIDQTIDDTIATSVVIAKTNISRPAIESQLSKDAPDASQNAAYSAVLYDYHVLNSGRLTIPELITNVVNRAFSASRFLPRPHVVSPNIAKIRSYQLGKFVPEAKAAMRAFMAPIIDAAFSPDKTTGNEKAAVKGRIEDLKNRQKPPTMTPFLLATEAEFLERLVPNRYPLVPLEFEDVAERQSSRTQTMLIHEAESTFEPKRIAKTFLKTEPYDECKDPRLITTFNPSDKVSYSRFTYAIADWMKASIACYVFGQVPSEVCTRVVRTCSIADSVAKTDFSRFDGTISEVSRHLERSLLYRLFPTTYHAELEDLHQAQYNLFAICTLGTRYETGFARGSGSPETSAFNSIINMYATFVGHRKTRMPSGNYMDADTAFARMNRGVYGGDDGLSPDLDGKAYNSACNDLGLKVKNALVFRGEFGIDFLARIYGEGVWYGDRSNCCDIVRQLSKLHTNVPRPENVPPETILTEKLMSFYITDRNTPIIGTFAKKVIELAGPIDIDTRHLTWLASQAKDGVPYSDTFCNFQADWYLGYVTAALPEFNFELFEDWIYSCTSLTQCLSPPLCMAFKPAKPHKTLQLVVDDQILPPEGEDDAPASPDPALPPAVSLAPKPKKTPPRSANGAEKKKKKMNPQGQGDASPPNAPKQNSSSSPNRSHGAKLDGRS